METYKSHLIHLFKVEYLKVLIPLLASILIGGCFAPSDVPSKHKVTLEHDASSPVLFISTQLNPVKEANAIRDIFHDNYPGEFDFQPVNSNFIIHKLESGKSKNKQMLLGARYGELLNLYEAGALMSVRKLIKELPEQVSQSPYLQLANFEGDDIFFIPWMQATYLMVANKKALPYLPSDADINHLTYNELLSWAINIKNEVGEAKLGFPLGENGLMHRFFQGYLYPSFTGAVVNHFNSDDAKEMWQYFRQLWEVTNPQSLSYTAMSEPFLTGEVWIGWDHSARLLDAFKTDSRQFIAFPAPAGPKGRSFMAIVSGLALPVGQQTVESAVAAIEFMSAPQTQLQILENTGFLPAAFNESEITFPASLQSIATAINKQAESSDAIMTLLPSGLGEDNALFNTIFTLSFSDIVLDNQDIDKVLQENTQQINSLFQRSKAPCWQPDTISGEPCAVKPI